MESTRIFVKGLPPNLSEAEFKDHFSKQSMITDAKFIPHRRIGYVGYRSNEDATKAVKYFNKSFIRMSRLAVELARPIGESPAPRGWRSQQKSDGTHKSLTDTPLASADSKGVKRKRDEVTVPRKDPKLEEFLRTMQPSSKSQTWANDTILEPVDSTTTDLEPAPQDAVPEPDSEAEYEVIPRKIARDGRQDSAAISQSVSVPSYETATSVSQGPVEVESPEESPPGNEGQATNSNSHPEQSDADWLRSRTNRLLELADDEDEAFGATVDRNDVQDIAQPVVPEGAKHSREGTLAPEPEVEEDPSQTSKADVDDAIESIERNGRLFVRNLPYGATEDDIWEHFLETGALEEVHLPIDAKSGSGKGFAYVKYQDPEAAIAAYKTLDGKAFQGRLLHVLPSAPKRESKLDEYAISQLPLKKQKQLKRKAEATTSTFNWNSLYMNTDAVISSISERLGVSKSDLLDPTSSDAAVKQAHAETHLIQETKAYFASNGVDFGAFKQRERGDTTILVKNFPYGTTDDEITNLFAEFGEVKRVLMPPAGTIAIVEFRDAPKARAAFSSLAYRKFKDSILFLEKAPKDLLKGQTRDSSKLHDSKSNVVEAKPATSDLLGANGNEEVLDSSTLFVRNLNFSTTTARLIEVFKPLDGFLSATVKTKKDIQKPGQVLSMGFGFLEFRTKAQAQAALKAMNGYNLDGHQLEIRASHRGADAAEERRKEQKTKKALGRRTKIIIKNLPFEASKKDVRALFGSYGQLRSVRVPKKFDSSTRGFAFADFVTTKEAENAMDALSNTHLLGRKLVLEFAAEDPVDAEEEIGKMQRKVGRQTDKVALQKLTGAGRKKFSVEGDPELADD